MKQRLGECWTFAKQYMWPSFYEALFVLAVSNASLFVLVIMYLATTKDASLTPTVLREVLVQNVQSAEVLVYVLALVAPASWIMMSHWRGRRHIGLYWLLFMFQVAIVLGSAVVYSLSKTQGISNPAFATGWAIACVLAGVLIWYVTLIYEKWIPSAVESSRPESGKSILDELEDGQ